MGIFLVYISIIYLHQMAIMSMAFLVVGNIIIPRLVRPYSTFRLARRLLSRVRGVTDCCRTTAVGFEAL